MAKYRRWLHPRSTYKRMYWFQVDFFVVHIGHPEDCIHIEHIPAGILRVAFF